MFCAQPFARFLPFDAIVQGNSLESRPKQIEKKVFFQTADTKATNAASACGRS